MPEENQDGLIKSAYNSAKDFGKDVATRDTIRNIAEGSLPSAVTDRIDERVRGLGDINEANKVIAAQSNKYVKAFLTEAYQILRSWRDSKTTLCCLIKLLASMGYGEETWRGVELSDKSFINQFRSTLSIVKGIIDIMSSLNSNEIKDYVFFTFDIITFLTSIMIGACVIIASTFIQGMGREISNRLNEQLGLMKDPEVQTRLGKCLPFDELITAAYDFFTYGITETIRQYSQDYMNKMKKDMAEMISLDEPEDPDATEHSLGADGKPSELFLKRLKYHEWLQEMSGLLGDIIDALGNVEFCVEMNLDARSGSHLDVSGPGRTGGHVGSDTTVDQLEVIAAGRLTADEYRAFEGLGDDPNAPDSGADRSVEGNPKAAATIGDVFDSAAGRAARKKAVAIPTDGELETFMSSRLGFTDSQIQQQLKADTGHVLDCGKVLTDEQYAMLNKLLPNLRKETG